MNRLKQTLHAVLFVVMIWGMALMGAWILANGAIK